MTSPARNTRTEFKYCFREEEETLQDKIDDLQEKMNELYQEMSEFSNKDEEAKRKIWKDKEYHMGEFAEFLSNWRVCMGMYMYSF